MRDNRDVNKEVVTLRQPEIHDKIILIHQHHARKQISIFFNRPAYFIHFFFLFWNICYNILSTIGL